MFIPDVGITSPSQARGAKEGTPAAGEGAGEGLCPEGEGGSAGEERGGEESVGRTPAGRG